MSVILTHIVNFRSSSATFA